MKSNLIIELSKKITEWKDQKSKCISNENMETQDKEEGGNGGSLIHPPFPFKTDF